MHCWNYETFKRVIGIWGDLISMGESWTRTNNFEKMEMLILIKQQMKMEEIVNLEVGKDAFSIRVREKGWSESTVKRFMNEEYHREVVDESISESESTIGRVTKKLQEGSRNVLEGAIMDVVTENEKNDNACQEMLGSSFDEEKQNSGNNGESNEGIIAERSYTNRAREDLFNMGLV